MFVHWLDGGLIGSGQTHKKCVYTAIQIRDNEQNRTVPPSSTLLSPLFKWFDDDVCTTIIDSSSTSIPSWPFSTRRATGMDHAMPIITTTATRTNGRTDWWLSNGHGRLCTSSLAPLSMNRFHLYKKQANTARATEIDETPRECSVAAAAATAMCSRSACERWKK